MYSSVYIKITSRLYNCTFITLRVTVLQICKPVTNINKKAQEIIVLCLDICKSNKYQFQGLNKNKTSEILLQYNICKNLILRTT